MASRSCANLSRWDTSRYYPDNMTQAMHIDFLRMQAQSAFSRASQLEDELISLRGLASRSHGELGSVCLAVTALCSLVEAEGCSPEVAQAIDDARAAMSGKHAHELMIELHYSYSWYCVSTVLQKMFRKMKSSPKLAKAAEKWMHEQLQRRGDASVHYQRRIGGASI